MFEKFKGLTRPNKIYFICVIVLSVILYISSITLSMKAFKMDTDPVTGIVGIDPVTGKPQQISEIKISISVLLFICAILSSVWSYYIYNDSKRQN
jgi:hypothetical protein